VNVIPVGGGEDRDFGVSRAAVFVSIEEAWYDCLAMSESECRMSKTISTACNRVRVVSL
jgi:hypothetical protein